MSQQQCQYMVDTMINLTNTNVLPLIIIREIESFKDCRAYLDNTMIDEMTSVVEESLGAKVHERIINYNETQQDEARALQTIIHYRWDIRRWMYQSLPWYKRPYWAVRHKN